MPQQLSLSKGAKTHAVSYSLNIFAEASYLNGSCAFDLHVYVQIVQ